MSISECSTATKIFSEKLTEIYKEKEPNVINDDDIRNSITNWLTTGTHSDYVDELLSSPDTQKNFPIWWSGFYLEDDSDKNPVSDMKTAANNLYGYSSLDTLMSSKALKEQNEFWNKCSTAQKTEFKWGEFISKTYTKNALQHNPKNIGLFLNKRPELFIISDFFKTEIALINDHYKNKKTTVNMYIFNLQDNCDAIIEKLEERKYKHVNFTCIGNCTNLQECVARKVHQSAGRRKSRKSKKK